MFEGSRRVMGPYKDKAQATSAEAMLGDKVTPTPVDNADPIAEGATFDAPGNRRGPTKTWSEWIADDPHPAMEPLDVRPPEPTAAGAPSPVQPMARSVSPIARSTGTAYKKAGENDKERRRAAVAAALRGR